MTCDLGIGARDLGFVPVVSSAPGATCLDNRSGEQHEKGDEYFTHDD